MTSRILFALAMTLPMTACLDSSPTDELETDDAAVGDDSKADHPGGTYTYYFVKADLRRCASPYCGGVFYRLANANKTVCLDGKKAATCYAATADYNALGLGEYAMGKLNDQMAFKGVLMRATIGKKKFPGVSGMFAKLNAKEAWLAQGPNAAAGPLMKIEDSGIRCITSPCPSFREKKLNSTAVQNIAELQWHDSGAEDALVGTAYEKVNTDGLIVSGYRTTVTGLGGEGKARSVNQFWFKLTNEAPAAECFVGGCSGQVCSDDPGVITTCEFRPEYACYKTATCEKQDDGQCGWTQTEELQACLASN